MSQDPHLIIKRPAARWYGGKWVLGKWIISHFPSHRIYVEPFSGMWSVGLQKQPSEIEVYNDLHDEAVNFWIQLRDHPQELIPLIESTYFDKELYDRACQPGGSTLSQAVKFYAQCLLSYTGGGVIAPGTSTARLQKPEVQKHDHLWAIAHRISNLQIFNKDAFDIIKEFDSRDTLFYCDPCYLPLMRASPRRYVHDMTMEQHQQLAALLNEVKGQVVLSGYPSTMYDSLYSLWQKSTKKTAANTTHKKTDECLWVKRSQSVLINISQTECKNNLSVVTGTEEIKKPRQPSQLYEKDSPQITPVNNIVDQEYSFGKLDISFGHTCDRLLSGSKTVTRRQWKPKHVAKFIKAYEEKQLVRALSKDRRYKGEQVGWLKLTSLPHKELLSQINQADCAAEGYPELTPQKFCQRFFKDVTLDTPVWVIYFEFIPGSDLPGLGLPCQPANCKPASRVRSSSAVAASNFPEQLTLPITVSTTKTMKKPSEFPNQTPDPTPNSTVENTSPLTTEQLTLPIQGLETSLDIVSEWNKDCWRTPNNKEQPILDLVTEALGGTIGLDPTADEQRLLPAQRHFTSADNCLIQDDWSSPAGTVFMNPPFSNPLPFLEKLIDAMQQGQLKEAIVLLPVSCVCNQGTGPLIHKYAQMICHWYSKRIAFLGEDGKVHKKPNFDSCFLYFGPNPKKFSDLFEKYGNPCPVNKKGQIPKTSENNDAPKALSDRQGLSRKPRQKAALTHTAINGRYEAASIYPGWQTAASINYIKERFDRLNTRAAKSAFADKWLGLCAQSIETALGICNELLEIVKSEEIYKVPEWMEGNVAYKDFDDYFDKRLNLSLQKWLQLLQKNSNNAITNFNQIPLPSKSKAKCDISIPSTTPVHPLPETTPEVDVDSMKSDRLLISPDTGDGTTVFDSISDNQTREPDTGDRTTVFESISDNQTVETMKSDRATVDDSSISKLRLVKPNIDEGQTVELNISDRTTVETMKSDSQLPERSTPKSKKRSRPRKNEGSGYLERRLCNIARNLARGKDPDYYWQYHYSYTDEKGIQRHRSVYVSKNKYSTVYDLVQKGYCHQEILETLKRKKK